MWMPRALGSCSARLHDLQESEDDVHKYNYQGEVAKSLPQ